MKRSYANLILPAALVGALIGFVTGKAVASSAAFAFTMNLRYVDGEKNKMLHTLDDGDLTLSGDLWVTGKKSKATSDPDSISISVYKKGLVNSELCSTSVIPDRIFNKKVAFSKSCGHAESDTYFLTVSKGEALDKTGDGWQIQGSGSLVTK